MRSNESVEVVGGVAYLNKLVAEGPGRALIVELGGSELIDTDLVDLMALDQRLKNISGLLSRG